MTVSNMDRLNRGKHPLKNGKHRNLLNQLIHSSPLRNILTYGIGLVLNKGVALIMLPFMAHYLSPEQIGKLDLLASVGAVAGIVIAFAMHEALYRFVGEEPNKSQRFRKASEIFSLTCLLSVVCSLCLFSYINFVHQNGFGPISHQQLNLLLVCAAMEGILGLSTAWLRMQDKATTFLYVSIATTTLQVSLILFVLLTNPNVDWILMCSACSYTVQFIALLMINRFRWVLPNKTDCRSLLHYGLPLMLTALVGFGLNGSERFFLAYSTDLDTLGQYAIAIKFSFAMCILVQPFGMWWMPKRFQVISQQGIQKAASITQMGIIYITLLTIAIAFAAKGFISLALPEHYQLSTQLVIGTLLVAWFKEVSELFNIGILYNKQTRTQLTITIVSTLIGLSAMWSLKDHGVWGIVLALAFAQASKSLITIIVSQKILWIPYSWRILNICVVALFTMLGLAYFIDTPWICIVLAMFSPILTITPILLITGRFSNSYQTFRKAGVTDNGVNEDTKHATSTDG